MAGKTAKPRDGVKSKPSRIKGPLNPKRDLFLPALNVASFLVFASCEVF